MDTDLPAIFVPLVQFFNGGFKNTTQNGIVDQAASNQSPITQLYISLSLGAFSILLFSILRLKWPAMFYSRIRLLKCPPPKLGDSIFGWPIRLYRIKESEVLKLVGLDALMLMRLFKLGAILFSIHSVYGTFVLMILTWTHPVDETENKMDRKKRLTIGVLGPGDSRLVAHCVGAYLFTLFAFYFLNREYQVYSSLRWSFLKSSRGSVAARSIMVEGIPARLRRGDLLKRYFEDLNLDTVEKTQMFYSAAELSTMVAYRSKALRRLETTITKWLGNPCVDANYNAEELRRSIESGTVVKLPDRGRPTVKSGLWGLMGPRVDAISHQHRILHNYSIGVRRLRTCGTRCAPSGVGFVTFNSIRTAHIAAQIVSNSQPFTLRTQLAPEPRDIYWSNVHLTARETTVRQLVVYIIMILVIFFYSIPLSIISSSLSLPKIVAAFPAFSDLEKLSPFVWALLSGVLPTVATITFIAATPFIFTGLSILQGAKAHSEIERMTVSKHFLFLLINVVLVFTVTNSLWGTFFGNILKDPSTIFTILGNSLPAVSPFFINYVMILGLGYFPLQLLQLGPVCLYVCRRIFARTPRDFAELLAPVFTDYGWLYGQPLLVFVTVMTYSVISPVILLVGTLYFAIGYYVTKYCLLYVYYRNYESGGLLWPLAFRRIMVGIFLLQITLTGQFTILEFPGLALAMLPLMGASALFFRYIANAYPHGCKYLPADFLGSRRDSCERLLVEVDAVEESFGLETDSIFARRTTTQDRSSLTCRTPAILTPDDQEYEEPYLAEPDLRTDYQQSPMFRFDGVLDSSIAEYANPATYADLPYLWLPQQLSLLHYQKLKWRRTCFCCFPISLRTDSEYSFDPSAPTSLDVRGPSITLTSDSA
ncbi:hypothetical protein L0F63_001217 [Massospora cicadina]|nr:hypothetical protein L0F63_001217 [Massospora cicadina]